LPATPATSSISARKQGERNDQEHQQGQAHDRRRDAVAMAQRPPQLAETRKDRHRDDHAPDDGHQERLGDGEAPESEQQEQTDPDDHLRRGARDGDIAVGSLHDPRSPVRRSAVAGGGQTAAAVKGLLRADVVAGEG
jgi:hypothetical protein